MAAFTSSIRSITLGFGNLFNRIQIVRSNDDGTENNRFLVPIQYSNKEKYLSRLQGDPNLDRSVQITLPAMSFEMTGVNYDASRKQNTNIKNFASNSNGVQSYYNPVPYNFDFQLYVYTRIEEDGVQIIERILPFFTPDYTIKVNVLPSANIIKEVPIVLTGTTYDTGYEGDYKSETRTIVWTLNFTVKGYLYIAPQENTSLIETVISNIITNIEPRDTVIFNMSQPGIGNYQLGELVYQGYSLGTAVATGTVSNWVNGNLYLTNMLGNFVTGSPIVCVNSAASYNFASYSNLGTTPQEIVQIVTTPNPNTALANNLYTFTTSIQEGEGAPVVITGNANNQIVFAPAQPAPFIFNEYDLML